MASETVTISTSRAPRTSSSVGGFSVDTSQLTDLAKRLRMGSPELSKQFRKGLREIGNVVAEEARSRSSFSTRIPGSIKVRVSTATVKIVAGGDGAEDAAPIENNGKGFVRHPVFGNREVWTTHGSHAAFLAPSVDAKAGEIETMTLAVVDETLQAIGL